MMCSPFCRSTIQYKSLRFEATEGVNKGLRGADQPLMNIQGDCDIIVAYLPAFPCISYCELWLIVLLSKMFGMSFSFKE